MNICCRFWSNCVKINTLKTYKQLLIQCMRLSSVGQRLATTEDIKRIALKKLNKEKTIDRKYGHEVVIYEATRHGFCRNIFMSSGVVYILSVFGFNMALHSYVNKDQLNPTGQKKAPIDQTLKIKSKHFKSIDFEVKCLYLNLVSTAIGHLLVMASILFTTRVVSSVVLRQARDAGVDSVRFYCYSIFGLVNTYHKHDIPLSAVSALARRQSTGRFMPIKVKGYFINFRIDRSGHFGHPMLFDQTVGVLRKL